MIEKEIEKKYLYEKAEIVFKKRKKFQNQKKSLY